MMHFLLIIQAVALGRCAFALRGYWIAGDGVACIWVMLGMVITVFVMVLTLESIMREREQAIAEAMRRHPAGKGL